MPVQRREKLLLTLALVLLAIIVLDRLTLAPLYRYFSRADEEISALENWL